MEVLRRSSLPSTLAFGEAAASAVSTFLKQNVNPLRQPRDVSHALPAVLMRAGTSKGLFVHRHHLPHSKNEWGRILSAAMGSSNADKRQLDGLGGASSTTSKAAVVSPSTHPDADVDYTFAQIAVGQDKVDLNGSCGNICSGVGAFALDEGLVHAPRSGDQATVKVHDTNTKSLISQTLQVNPLTGLFNPIGNHSIAGYAGTGSPIQLAWRDAVGTAAPANRPKRLFPTGTATDKIAIPHDDSHTAVTATLIDATNPFVLVDASTLPASLQDLPPGNPALTTAVESIRRHASVLYGLAPNHDEAGRCRAVPKIALLHPPTRDADVRASAYSMGVPHPGLQLTGTLCIATALTRPGTVASQISARAKNVAPPESTAHGEVIRSIEHPGGVAEAVVRNSKSGALESVGMVTTARRLFKGEVVNAVGGGVGGGGGVRSS